MVQSLEAPPIYLFKILQCVDNFIYLYLVCTNEVLCSLLLFGFYACLCINLCLCRQKDKRKGDKTNFKGLESRKADKSIKKIMYNDLTCRRRPCILLWWGWDDKELNWKCFCYIWFSWSIVQMVQLFQPKNI
jgi:hypothetical protein